MLACAVGSAVIYGVRSGNRLPAQYLAGALATAAIPLFFPLLWVMFGKKIPVFICINICVHLVCAADLGTVLKFYDMFAWWDLFAHGYFGFNAALITYWFLASNGEVKLKPVYVMLFALSVALALGALWEITEYITDCIFSADSQRVAESIALGKSPVADTMEDLMITVAGVAVLAVLFMADCFTKQKLFRKLGINGNAANTAAKREAETLQNKDNNSD